MIGRADRIVYGEILAVEADTVKVAIRDAWPEAPSRDETIDIVRPEIYDRPEVETGYEPGQTYVWLLIWGSDTAIVDSLERWRILGPEGAGEFPATERCVFLPEGLVPVAQTSEHEIHGTKRRVHRLPRVTFWDAVASYRACVNWTDGSPDSAPRAQWVCDPGEIGEFANRSDLHRYLASTAPQ